MLKFEYYALFVHTLNNYLATGKLDIKTYLIKKKQWSIGLLCQEQTTGRIRNIVHEKPNAVRLRMRMHATPKALPT